MRPLRWLLLGSMLALTALPLPAATPDILLANVYRDDIDLTKYLVSEKLDGVRAIWDGQQLVFRSGQPINAPPWFIAALPATPLDGELWLGRGGFERLSGIVRRETPVDAEWQQVRYMLFELPNGSGSFRQRAEQLREIAAQAAVPWLQAVAQEPVANRQALRAKLNAILKAGGEGLMLHRAGALFETGRSDTLLKLKPWLDAEAVVIGHIPGQGKYAGQLGALQLRCPDGRQFKLGTGFTDAQRQNPPPIGSTVTYRYRQLTANGLPRFASFLRIREDFSADNRQSDAMKTGNQTLH
ncbi:MAG: DNA ligase [Azonexus sp.]|jgi:DNA ligase-1|nr:DNA ligase [Azonexus sp.]